MSMFTLSENILLGCATAATQIEGGDKNNSWYDWANIPGHIADGSTPLRATDHYKKVKADTSLMAKMGLQVYRLGLEWSRIEPEQGKFNKKAIEHYRNEIQLLLENGIQPLVTLHHFTNPTWFEKMGAFEHEDAPEIFLDYVRFTVEELCDIVSDWITINEPNVYTVNGYIFGTWPPGKKGDIRTLSKVYTNLCACHIASYKEIHRMRLIHNFDPKTTHVSFANHMRIFEPKKTWNPLHRLSNAFMKYGFQDALTQAMMTGKATWPVNRLPLKVSDVYIHEGRYYDFIGLNYYTRDAITTGKRTVFEQSPVNDLGWEIYPQGLVDISESLYKKYVAPIWITENGTCDNNDSFRCRYIYDHLLAISKSTLPIQRYYHWSFMDNFEWAEGEEPRFGIVHVDYETQKRTIKKSGQFFSEIIKERGVTESMYEKYVKEETYNYL